MYAFSIHSDTLSRSQETEKKLWMWVVWAFALLLCWTVIFVQYVQNVGGFLCVHVQLQVGVMCVCLCDVCVCVMCVWCMCLMCVCLRECLCLWPSIIQVQLCLETSHCHVLHILFCAICKYFTPCCVQAAKCSQLFFVPLFSVFECLWCDQEQLIHYFGYFCAISFLFCTSEPHCET